jgi:ferredoxin-NADP reductase
MRALFETLPLAPGDDLLLLYRASSAGEILFRDELDAIAARRPARVEYVVGKDRSALSAPSLEAAVPNLAERDVYMCGPPKLTAALRKALRVAGLPPGQLHEERFSF